MALSLLTDARGEKRSEVESSPRTTRYAPGMEMSPLDQFFPHTVGCAQRRSEGPCSAPDVSVSGAAAGNRCLGVGNINIGHFVLGLFSICIQ